MGLGHDHGHSHDTNELSDSRLLFSIGLNLLLTVAEIIGGIFSGSLSLIADAVHNFNDAAALLIAWGARKIARKKADDRFTFGYKRAELIGALVNLTTLFIIGLYLIWESVQRFIDPQPIDGVWVMAIAGVALVVDIATAALLWAMSRGNLNVYAAFIHNLTDAGASLAVVIGGALVWWKGWLWVDPALTALIASYIIYLCVGMFRRTASILMENSPPDLDLDDVRKLVDEHSGVEGLEHLHVWELDEHRAALELTIFVSSTLSLEEAMELKRSLKEKLAQSFDIGHATIEVDPVDG